MKFLWTLRFMVVQRIEDSINLRNGFMVEELKTPVRKRSGLFFLRSRVFKRES